MLRVGFFGKRLPVLGVAIILLLPMLGTTLGMVHPTDSIGGLGESATDPIPIGGPESQPEQPAGPVTPSPSEVVGDPPGESAVVITSDEDGIRTRNAPNETEITVRDDGSGFWFSTRINESHAGSTMQLWVDINNTASGPRKAQLAIEPEAPLDVDNELNTSPEASQDTIMTEQRESVSNVWTVRVAPEVSGETSVTDEPIIDAEAIKHRTNRVVADRNRDGNITTADIEFGNTDMTDGVDAIKDLRLNDDGTATLYLNGSTDDDGTYDTISYSSGTYLVISIRIPEGTSPGTYTIEGELQPTE